MRSLSIARRAGRAIAIAVVFVFLVPSAAFANHLPQDFGPRWGADPTVVFTEGFPGGTYRDRIRSGVNEWNVVGTPRRVNVGGNIPNFNPLAGCPPVQNQMSVHWIETTSLGHPDALGLTTFCTIGGARYSSNVDFDTDRDWYTGTGDANDGFLNWCIGGCQDDFWSVASHEFGHGMAFGHFIEADSVCPDSNIRHTMCPSIYGGTERQRDYEIHEEEAFHIAY